MPLLPPPRTPMRRSDSEIRPPGSRSRRRTTEKPVWTVRPPWSYSRRLTDDVHLQVGREETNFNFERLASDGRRCICVARPPLPPKTSRRVVLLHTGFP
ncbi:hypothetical protein LSAT2_003462 [Lamellibrachia satsuma]|nr:hypothetical protein LSAT2_003462 [Lamellibrachia satsuma]